MYFDSFSDFIAMGGHGLYVWLCYGIAITILSFNIISPLLKSRNFFNQQGRRLRRERQMAEQEGSRP
ncbi:heme exporter protein CcmD [Motiliproteus sediminis]|uniref:heme exporter protein CcmD n=1 Tax=Motiliproteus sediminis TaxID=1468178 RepID=UPI001AF01BAE|nr:heme exporter protein CcmD [Motiliproteus sediminis]